MIVWYRGGLDRRMAVTVRGATGVFWAILGGKTP